MLRSSMPPSYMSMTDLGAESCKAGQGGRNLDPGLRRGTRSTFVSVESIAEVGGGSGRPAAGRYLQNAVIARFGVGIRPYGYEGR